MIAFERRASTVLYKLLSSRRDSRPFLLPANACPIVPITLTKAGIPFDLVDISNCTLCMDEDAALARVRRNPGRYGGLIYVRNYGFMCDINDFFAEIKRIAPDVLVIDDHCLCPPEFSTSVRTGVDAVLYSTGHAKYVDLGYGGYGILGKHVSYCDSRSPFDVRVLDRLTLQYKTALAAGIPFAYEDGEWLDQGEPSHEWPEYQSRVRHERGVSEHHKHAINEIYQRGFRAEIQLPLEFQHWRFNILVRNAQHVLESISAAGLFASNHYAPLSGVFSNEDAPYARALHTHVVNLFNDQYFDEDQAGRLVEVVARIAEPISEDGALRAPRPLK